MQQIDTTKINKCLVQALSSRNDPIAFRASLTMAERMTVKELGVDLIEYFESLTRRVDPATIKGAPETSYTQISAAAANRENAELRDENEKLKTKVVSLETAKATSAQPVVAVEIAYDADGNASWDDFYRSLVTFLGSTKRALTIYSESLGVSPGKVQVWRREKRVQKSDIEAIYQIDKGAIVQQVHQPMTADCKARIDELSRAGTGDSDIAKTLSAEFPDRTFNDNMIKGAKTQIRTAFLHTLRGDGKTRDEARSLFIERYPNVRKLDSMLDKVFPTLN